MFYFRVRERVEGRTVVRFAPVTVAEGVHQGDVWGPLLYALGLYLPMLSPTAAVMPPWGYLGYLGNEQ